MRRPAWGNPFPLQSPTAAAFLSFLLPGLGQLAAGRRRRGLFVALPAIAAAVILLGILLFNRGLILGSFSMDALAALFLVNVVVLLYRLWAIFDAYLIVRWPKTRTRVPMARPQPKVQTKSAAMFRGRRSPLYRIAAAVWWSLALSSILITHAVFASIDLDTQHALYCMTAENPCPRPGAISGGDDSNNPYLPSLDLSPDASGSGASASPVDTYSLGDLPSFPTTVDSEKWAADGQFNVLLLGVGVGGDNACAPPNQDLPCRMGPDTLMVLHIDLATGRAAMIGVGRNNICVPLPQGIAEHYSKSVNGCPPYTYPYMINSLGMVAWTACGNLPFYQDSCGQSRDVHAYQRAMRAFEVTLGGLLGLTIDGSVTINPIGLSVLIEDLGGVTINVKTKLYDKPCGPAGSWQQQVGSTIAVPGTATCADAHNGYSVPTGVAAVQKMKGSAAAAGATLVWSKGQDIAFVIQTGTHHMDGDWALAYARTRIYSNDFSRMARQQELLKAMRAGLNPCTDVWRLPSLINHIYYAFHTNLPLNNGDDVRAWAGLAQHMLGSDVKTIVLDPTSTGMSSPYGYPAVNAASWAKIKSVVAHSLDGVPAASGSGGGGGGGGGFTC